MDPLAPYILTIFNTALVAATIWFVTRLLTRFERSRDINCPPGCPLQAGLRNLKTNSDMQEPEIRK
jgi:hypothetical protein